MESPQMAIMKELLNDDDKKFALIINDVPIEFEGRQVYVRSQRSKLVAVVYAKQKNKSQATEVPVDLEKNWNALMNNRRFFGFDFTQYYNMPGTKFTVNINRTFELLFIETPAITLIKQLIQAMAKENASMSVSGVSNEFRENFRNQWRSIQSQFQVYSFLSYKALVNQLMKRKLTKKMHLEQNRLFKETLVAKKINFLHLFLHTKGLYNPFLEDKQLMAAAQNTWFLKTENNDRLFMRTGGGKDGGGYSLYCMTLKDFCQSIGIEYKLGFNSETALAFLFSLLYAGIFNNILVPSEHMKGYMYQDFEVDSQKLVRANFTNFAPPATAEDDNNLVREIRQVSGLDAFCFNYAYSLVGESAILPQNVKNILLNAHLERR